MGWIGVDLDGTLAHYESGQWPEIGEPIVPMVNRVKRWLEQGKEVRIMTARAAHGEEEVARVREWLSQHGLGQLPVTNEKDPQMDMLWDDKAVQVRPNTGEPILDEHFQESLAESLHFPDFNELDKPFGVFRALEMESKKR